MSNGESGPMSPAGEGDGTGDTDIPTGGPGDEGNTSSDVQSLEVAMQRLWTAEHMEAAQPCDILEIEDEEVDAAAEDEVVGERERMIPAGEPQAEEEESAGGEDLETAAGFSYPPPFSRWENFCDYKLFPFRAVGKLFFQFGDTNFVCSAASVGNCAIFTAGHCLHRGNNSSDGWARNVVFVPAYRDGNAPFGQWPARRLWVRTSWYKNGIPKGLAQDMGGAVLHRQNKRKISQVVGWLGFAWNWSRRQHWLSHGYPAAAPFNGRRMQINAASFAYSGKVGASPRPVGMGNDLTGGSSGGPWIWKFGAGNYLNGVNSYRRKSKPKEMYSPYFGNHAKALFDDLRSQEC